MVKVKVIILNNLAGSSNVSTGTASIEFETEESAKKAQESLNNQVVNREDAKFTIGVEFFSRNRHKSRL